MTKRGKKTAPKKRASAHPPHTELRAAGPEAAQPKGPLLPEKKRPFWERARSELRPIVLSLFVAGLLIVAKKYWVERTDFAQQLDQAGARFLQNRLIDSSGKRGDQIRIVDISSLKPSSPASATNNVVVTDRKALQEYLDQVAKADPKAIGIDIVFDPVPGGTVSDEDYNFLDHCLNLRGPSGRRIPVLVGIYKSLALGQDRWLGDKRFAELGASIVIPFEEHKSMPTGSMFKTVNFTVNKKPVEVNSFSYSLFLAWSKTAGAEAGRGSVRQAIRFKIDNHSHYLDWLFADPPIKKGHIEADSFAIDFGVLPNLMNKKYLIPAEKIRDPTSDLKDKIVLIGRATPGEAPDAFNTTGSDEPIPGIFIHAAALDTLMEAHLFKLSDWGEFLIDLALSLILVFYTILMSFLLDSITHSTLRMNLEVAMPALLAAFVILAGGLIVYLTGIYWTDFIVVAFLLLFHKPVEAVCHIAWEMAQKSPRLLWRKT